MKRIDQFANKQYLNLETFRRNGEGMKTPVWFAQEGEVLYIMTAIDSGKAKRIRRDGRVNLAPCRADGKVIGDWVRAQACEITDPVESEKIKKLLVRKYRLLYQLFARQRASRGSQDTYLEIKLLEEKKS